MSYKEIRNGVAILAFSSIATLAQAADSGDSSNIFAGDIGNVLWTLVIFGATVFVLGKYAWGPILNNLQAREDFIHDSLEKARKDRDEAEARLKEYEERLNTARAEATSIVEEGRRDAEVLRHRIETEAQAEAAKMLDRAKREIDIARDTAIKDLYTVSGDLAIGIASRVVGRELSKSDHERLIDESIAELAQIGSTDGQQADA